MAVGLKSMAVALKSKPEAQPIQSYQPSGSESLPGKGGSVRRLRQVSPLPNHRQAPLWLKSLITAQRSTSVIALILMTVVLTIYGKIAYSDEVWSRQYLKLEDLQRHERQLMTANETLKNHIAQQVEAPNSGFVTPSPNRVIFLKPAPIRPSNLASATNPLPPTVVKPPRGY